MAVTTMRLTKISIKQFEDDFAAYSFVEGDDFMWSPATAQIVYRSLVTPEDAWTLLHEIAHAELDHSGYDLDVELVAREVAAWEHARAVLAPRYTITIEQDHIEDHLDTYREWLNERSLCPECGQNGFQTTTNTYRCNNCRCLWRVNEARICRLRRIKLRE